MTADTVALVSRRAFLQGGRAVPVLPRPPGALADGDFESACTRCGDCLAACPDGLLVKGEGGFPVYEAARGECTFCGDCTRACGSGALLPARIADWPWRARVDAACLSAAGVLCLACKDACAAAAIRFPPGAGLGAPAIDGGRCTGCGACVAACPAGALALRQPAAGAAP